MADPGNDNFGGDFIAGLLMFWGVLGVLGGLLGLAHVILQAVL